MGILISPAHLGPHLTIKLTLQYPVPVDILSDSVADILDLYLDALVVEIGLAFEFGEYITRATEGFHDRFR